MNAEIVLRYFDRISEAAGSIQQMRRFIYDLAVRGKLVTQIETDDSPVEALTVLASKRNALVRKGELRNIEPVAPVDAPLVDLPRRWIWAFPEQLSQCVNNALTIGPFGSNLVTSDYTMSGVPLVFVSDIRSEFSGPPRHFISSTKGDELKSHSTQAGDLLITKMGDPPGDTAIYPHGRPRAIITADCIKWSVDPTVACTQYLYFALRAPFLIAQITGITKGAAHQKVSLKRFRGIHLPLPPIAEQHRIVSKVDELMALCDRLEEARKEREARRDRLTAASLPQLNNSIEGDELRQRTRFFMNQLPKVTARPDQIKLLRQTILDLAVRGCLAHQGTEDELVADSLKRIQLERGELVKQGRLRPDKPTSPIDLRDTPFNLPRSWSWVRIAQASLFTEYGTSYQSAHTESGVPTLKMGDIQDGSVILGGQKKVPDSIDDLPGLYLRKYDLLYNRTNSAELVGKTGIYLGEDHEYTFASYLIRIRFSTRSSDPRFFNLAMNAPYFRATQIVPHLKQQCGQANVNGTTLKGMLVPFPPIAEQRRIVAKVEQLMSICDQLERQLASAQTQGNLLLKATLHETIYSEHVTAEEVPGGFRSGGYEIGALQ